MANKININDLIEKTKKLNNESLNLLTLDNVKKAAITTAVIAIPGSFVVGGAYVLGKKIVASYGKYKQQNPQGQFNSWISEKTKEQYQQNILGIRQKISQKITTNKPKQ